MKQPEIQIYSDSSVLTMAAAERLTTELAAALREKETATFVLAGGSTPKPIYRAMAEPPYRDQIDWRRIHFFWGDERCVPPDDPESNYGMAWNELLSKISIPETNVIRIPAEMDNHEEAALRYEAEIRRSFKDSAPAFDLVLLGMGDDGHTASLFPGTRWKEERLVVANYSQKLNSYRISMTPGLLNQARTVLFVIAGAQKAEVVARILHDRPGDFPAARISPSDGHLCWMLDRSAASLLKNDGV